MTTEWPKEKFMDWNRATQCEFIDKVSKFFPRMTSAKYQCQAYPPLWSQSFLNGLQSTQEEWVFYGGSFNPWHQGHSACLDLLPHKKIVILPDRNPWKKEESLIEENLCLFLDQLSQKIHPERHALYPGFLAMDGVNPTIDWFSKVVGKKSLLIGADNLLSFSKWKDYQHLLAQVHCLYVAPRTIEQSEEQFAAALEHCRLFAREVRVLDRHDFEDLSSTKLRR